MANNVVLFEKEGPIGLITINRPEVRNSLNAAVFLELNGIIGRIAADDGIRTVVVTGAGKAFVSGADINELLSLDPITGWSASRFQQSVLTSLERLGKPSLAAINGAALGGGLELALACTMRFASRGAKMGFPELGLGIVPGFGGTQRLIRTVGKARAAEMLLRRSIIDADQAQSIGLVNGVFADDVFFAGVMDVARDLATVTPACVRLTMELLNYAQGEGFDAGMAMESALASLTLSSPAAKELLGLFLSKRKE